MFASGFMGVTDIWQHQIDACGRGLAATLANARLEVFNDVNHCPCVEAPDKATALIEERLKPCFG